MACFLCGAESAVVVCVGDDEAACAEIMAAWRPTGLLNALGEDGSPPRLVDLGQPADLP